MAWKETLASTEQAWNWYSKVLSWNSRSHLVIYHACPDRIHPHEDLTSEEEDLEVPQQFVTVEDFNMMKGTLNSLAQSLAGAHTTVLRLLNQQE